MFPSNSTNFTEEDRMRYFDKVKEVYLQEWRPTVAFLVVVAIVGLFGNSLVLRVYWKRVRRDATDTFIMAIATCDLLTNFIVTPVSIQHILQLPVSKFVLQCQFQFYLIGTAGLASLLLCLGVTICRHRKICQPFQKPISIKTAKISFIVIAVISGIILLPTLFIFVMMSIPTEMPGVYQQSCSTRQDPATKTVDFIYFVVTFVVLIPGMLVALVTLNVRICIQAWRHSRKYGIPITAKTPNTPVGTSRETKNSAGKRRVLTRTTVMMVAISMTFVISFLPLLVLILCHVTLPVSPFKLSVEVRAVCNLLARFYFINSGVNAIIYGFCDARFRKEVATILCSSKSRDTAIAKPDSRTTDSTRASESRV